MMESFFGRATETAERSVTFYAMSHAKVSQISSYYRNE